MEENKVLSTEEVNDRKIDSNTEITSKYGANQIKEAKKISSYLGKDFNDVLSDSENYKRIYNSRIYGMSAKDISGYQATAKTITKEDIFNKVGSHVDTLKLNEEDAKKFKESSQPDRFKVKTGETSLLGQTVAGYRDARKNEKSGEAYSKYREAIKEGSYNKAADIKKAIDEQEFLEGLVPSEQADGTLEELFNVTGSAAYTSQDFVVGQLATLPLYAVPGLGQGALIGNVARAIGTAGYVYSQQKDQMVGQAFKDLQDREDLTTEEKIDRSGFFGKTQAAFVAGSSFIGGGAGAVRAAAAKAGAKIGIKQAGAETAKELGKKAFKDMSTSEAAKTFLKSAGSFLAKEVAPEGIEEGIEEIIQIANAQGRGSFISDFGDKAGEIAKDLHTSSLTGKAPESENTKRFLKSVELGMLGGLGMGGVANIASSSIGKFASIQNDKKVTENIVQSLDKTVENTQKIKEEMGADVAEVYNKALAEKGVVPNITITPAAYEKILAQENSEEIIGELGIESQINMLEAGNDIEVDFEKYQNFATSEDFIPLHQSMKEDITAGNPENKSAADIRLEEEDYSKNFLNKVEEKVFTETVFKKFLEKSNLSEDQKADVVNKASLMAQQLAKGTKTNAVDLIAGNKGLIMRTLNKTPITKAGQGYKNPVLSQENIVRKDLGKVSSVIDIKGRMSVEGTKNLIELFANHDTSTVMHELNHWFFKTISENHKEENLSPEWKENYEKVMEWVGSKDGKLTPAQYEKIAEGFEKKLFDGESSSKALDGFYDQMKEWMRDIYSSMKEFGIKVPEDISKVYDEMFISRAEILAVEEQQKMAPIDRPEGVSEEEFTAYEKVTDKARSVEEDILSKANRVADEYIESISVKNRVKSLKETFIEQNKKERGFVLKEIFKKDKLNRQELIDMGYKVSAIKSISSSGGVLNANATAGQFKYKSISDMVTDMNSRGDLEYEANKFARAEQRKMLGEYKAKEPKTDAKKVTKNFYRFRQKIMEGLMKNKNGFSSLTKTEEDIVSDVEKNISKMKFNPEFDTKRFIKGQVRASILSEQNFDKGNGDLGFIEKLKEAWNIMAQDKVTETTVIAEDLNKKIEQIRKETKNTVARYGGVNVKLAKAIAVKYGLLVGVETYTDEQFQENFSTTSENMVTSGFSASSVEMQNSRGKLANADPEAITYASIKDASNLINVILEYGKSSNKIKDGIYRQDLENESKVFVANTENKTYKKKKQKKANSEHKTAVEKLSNKVGEYYKSATNFEHVAKGMGEWFSKNKVRPIIDGFVKADEDVRNFTEGFAKKAESLGYKLDFNKHELIQGKDVPFSSKLMLFLYKGRADTANLLNKTVMEQFDIQNIKEAQTFLDSVLNSFTEEEVQLAEYIYEMNDKAFETRRKAALKIEKMDLQKSKTNPFTIKINGKDREIKGGYVRKNSDKQIEVEMQQKINNGAGLNIFDGSNNKVLDRAIKTLSMDPNALTQPVYEASMYANTVYPTIEFSNFVEHNKDYIKDKFGQDVYEANVKWVEALFKTKTPDDFTTRVVKKITTAAKISILGLNPVQLFVQSIGFLAATPELRGYLAPHVGKALLSSPTRIFNKRAKAEKMSLYMQDRVKDGHKFALDLLSGKNVITQGKLASYNKKAQSLFMEFVLTGDFISSEIVWNASYDKAMAELNYSDKEARSYADSQVRTTQGDFSRYSLQQGEFMKTLFPFASFFITQLNNVNYYAKAGSGREQLIFMVAMFAMSPALEAYIRHGVKGILGDEDEWEREDYWENIGINIAQTGAGVAMPGIGSDLIRPLYDDNWYSTKKSVPFTAGIESFLTGIKGVKKTVTGDEQGVIDMLGILESAGLPRTVKKRLK